MKKLIKFLVDVALVSILLSLATSYGFVPGDTSTLQTESGVLKVKQCKPIIRVIEKTTRITKGNGKVRVQITRVTKGN